ncbi:MAG: hypothetical protein E7200_14530 [Selenomonas ruminantium]|nr:hypothetical protein [Selenomonas ruminantium]
MIVAAQGARVIEAGLREAETGREAYVGEDFRSMVAEEVRQQTLAELQKENELCGLQNVKRDLQMQINNPHLLNIHRRVMADGSYIITEKHGEAQVSHYCKRLECRLLTVER